MWTPETEKVDLLKKVSTVDNLPYLSVQLYDQKKKLFVVFCLDENVSYRSLMICAVTWECLI